MITRARLEAVGSTENEVRNDLVALTVQLNMAPPVWEAEQDVSVQTTKDGFWGFITVRRKDAT